MRVSSQCPNSHTLGRILEETVALLVAAGLARPDTTPVQEWLGNRSIVTHLSVLRPRVKP